MSTRIMILLSAVLVFCCWNGVGAKQEARGIQIMNTSNRRVELYWIHPDTKEMVLQSNPVIYHGASFSLNSYVSHAFEIRELAASRTGMCGDDGQETNECRKGYFTVNANEDQVIVLHPGFVVEHTDNKSVARKKALDVMGECQAKALAALKKSSSSDADSMGVVSPQQSQDAIQDLVQCVEGRVASAMEKVEEEISFESNLRQDMASLLEDYTCQDDELNTTEAKSSNTFKTRDGKNYRVHTLHDRPTSKVHYLDKFLTERECEAVLEEAEPNLSRSYSRDGNLIAESATVEAAAVRRKVYDYVNSALKLEEDNLFQEQGQEPLRLIKLNPVSENEDEDDQAKEPDQYKPHCDGPCHSAPSDLKRGTVVVTMLLYCSVPTKGGATNFRNAGLHIVPEHRGATFLASADIENETVDRNAFTEYSMCPVRGETPESVVVSWIRYGVDANQAWDSFE